MRRTADFVALLISLGFVALGGIALSRGQDFAGWLSIGFFGICALITGYQVYSGRTATAAPEGARPKGKPRAKDKIKVTKKEILHYRTDGEVSAIAWDQILQVALVAEDGFPVGGLWWVLIGADATGCRIPSDAQGNESLLEAMQDRLPGFDNQGVVAAMGALEGSKILWRKA